MDMKTIDDLFAYREKVDKYMDKKRPDKYDVLDKYQKKWEKVAPELLDVTSCILPWAEVKVKFGYGGVLEIKIRGLVGGGCMVSLTPVYSLYLINDSIRLVENSVLYKNKQEILYSESKEDNVCSFSTVTDKNIVMMEYLLVNWETVKPIFIKNIASNLRAWGQMYDEFKE